jgi:ATP synthase protein I
LATTSKKNPKKSSNKKPLNAYARYSGLAIQMVVVVVLGILGGRWLDSKVENETPWWTVGGALFGIFGAMFYLFKEVKAGMNEDQ